MPLIKGIDRAKKTVDIVIFRFNRSEIEKALAAAVARGVHVHALIAWTNHGGEQSLRDLEMRLLAAGVTVSRTDDDLARYHSKLMIIDRRVLYVLAFNFTYLDMERSRSFGLVTTNKKHVEQAAKLFAADTTRQPYMAGSPTFLVSPVNARRQMAAFLKGAKKELLIYDPEISDPAMIRILEARARAGVTVRVIGKVKGRNHALPEPKAMPMRLHTRSIVRDGSWAFVGSQSLRALELDARREVGVLFRDAKAVGRLLKTFQQDWDAKEAAARPQTLPGETEEQERASAAKVATKVARAVVEDLAPVKQVLNMTVKELSGDAADLKLDHPRVEASVRQAVKDAVKQVVRDFVEEATESPRAGAKA